MSINYFEDLLSKPDLFKSEKTLDINYIPDLLPHREKEISLLSRLFISLISNPNSISRKILITGKTGIGKTVTVKVFGIMLQEAAIKRDVKIKYIHINCRKERTSYKVLVNIVRNLDNNFPKRGYSPQDLLEIITKSIKVRNIHILLVLDELNYLIDKDKDFLYSLTRIYDDTFNRPQRLSLIGIVRDISFLSNLDISTLSTLQRNIIKFNNYSINQIFDILRYRSELGLKKGAISDELLKMLSEIVYEKGDLRYGINLLWKASKIAENKNLSFISPECLRLANEELVPYPVHDTLKYLSIEKLIFLLSIIKTIKKLNNTSISLSDTLEIYQIVCENLKYSMKSYSQCWNYLTEFKKEGIISIEIKSKDIQGRKSLIKILDIPLEKLERIILNLLNNKGLSI